MPIGLVNLEWLNHNASRNYPLADDATGADATGSFVLPKDFIVSLDLPVHAGLAVDPAGFFVRRVGAYANGYSVVVGYKPDAGDPVDVATCLIASSSHEKNRSYALGGVGDFDDSVGKVSVGALSAIAAQPPGQWEFSFAAGRLDPDAIRPMLRGVSSVVLVNGEQRSQRLYGDVELVAGSNCQLVPVVVEGLAPRVYVNFLQGEGTSEECVCVGDAAQAPPLRRLGGVAPTAAGDAYILGSDCMRIEEIENGLRIVNTCASPCCGCPELEKITTDLVRFSREKASVDIFVNRLAVSADAMSLTVLGARLGDRPCFVS